MTQTSNVGETGVRSIRLNGGRIDELPIAEAAAAKDQLPVAEQTERENIAENIRARYPKHSREYLDSRITECEENVRRMHAMIGDQNAMISDYKGHISLCKHRDEEIARLGDDPDPEAIKDLKRRFPEYDVGKMEEQIVMCKEAIERANAVIDREHDSIAELREVQALIEQRDNDLKRAGVA